MLFAFCERCRVGLFGEDEKALLGGCGVDGLARDFGRGSFAVDVGAEVHGGSGDCGVVDSF